jgi:hypothetical protein
MFISIREGQHSMFAIRFADYLYPDHEFLRASHLIDGDSVPGPLSGYYRSMGRSGSPFV